MSELAVRKRDGNWVAWLPGNHLRLTNSIILRPLLLRDTIILGSDCHLSLKSPFLGLIPLERLIQLISAPLVMTRGAVCLRFSLSTGAVLTPCCVHRYMYCMVQLL